MNALPAPDTDRARWPRALATLIVLLFAIVLLYRSTALSMVAIWLRSETFNHAFVVAPISLWLIWRRRDELAQQTPRPSLWTLGALAAAGLFWLLGELATVGVVAQFALTSMLLLCVPALLGWPVARCIAFPLAFVYFAVPFGEFAMPQLMEWTADFTVLGLRLSGIPVYREGLEFVIPSGNWSVIEACSGVRYLIASLMLGTLFAYLSYRSFWRRAIFIGVSLLVPLLANWLRAYVIVMLGHFSGNTLATGVDHLIYGWLFFGVVILLMFVIGNRWAEPEAAATVAPAPAVAGGAAVGAAGLGVYAVLAFAVLAIAPLAQFAIERGAPATVPVLPIMSQLEDSWQKVDGALSPAWQPAFVNPSAQSNTLYAAHGQLVGLYLGYYRRQNGERKLISSENVLVRSQDAVWAVVSSGQAPLSFAGKEITARSAELRAGSAQAESLRLSVRQLYWINGRLTRSDPLAKLYTALLQLTGHGDDSAVIILYAPKDQAGGGARALADFAQANSARIVKLLADVRASRSPALQE
ncbi:MAG: xrtA [Proteobacteria bacterium]|nr:xrtA [Pseudomonadota bacterium]